MSDISYMMLKGKCKWAKVHDPVPTFDESGMQYEIEIEVTDEMMSELYNRGMSQKRKAKEDDTGAKFLKLTKPTMSRQGKELKAPVVIGRDCKPFNEPIGNGSEVAIKVVMIPYDNKFGKGVSLRLGGVQVIDHVKFEEKSSSPELDGFEVLDVEDTDDPLASMVSDEDI